MSAIAAESVEFVRHRWYVAIRITTASGQVQEFIADAQLQSGDGVWFGTRAEYDEALEEL